MWGSTVYSLMSVQQVQIFPTDVGINRAIKIMRTIDHDIPHGCGDQPETKTMTKTIKSYSPRMWGSTEYQ